MISVLGCGWLGLPLAKYLKSSGYHIKGSTTKKEKLDELSLSGIDPYIVQLSHEVKGDKVSSFLDSEILIINIPPGRKPEEANKYVDKMLALKKEIELSPIKKIIFISSTSVYEEVNSIVNEESLISKSESAQRLYNAEQIFWNSPELKTTIIRMSGLIGPKRHPGRFFAGKENIPDGLIPVNLIHLDDCISIITKIIERNIWGEKFNAAAPSHPTKMEFYQKATSLLSGQKAHFLEEKKEFKIISSEKLVQRLNYEFKYADLLSWLDEA